MGTARQLEGEQGVIEIERRWIASHRLIASARAVTCGERRSEE